MKLEDQVAPLALARRMKELGFPQETCFAWVSELLDNGPDAIGLFERHAAPNHGGADVICAASAVAEMGEWLPEENHAGYAMSYRTQGREWAASCFEELPTDSINGIEIRFREPVEFGTTEAEARARLLIALAESGALDPRGLR